MEARPSGGAEVTGPAPATPASRGAGALALLPPPTRARGSSVRTLRQANRQLLLGLLRSHGPLTKAALAQGAGLSPQGVAPIVAELVAEGLVLELAPASGPDRRRGRPPVRLAFNPEAVVTAAVVLEPGIWHVVVADGLGGQRGRRTVLDRPRGPDLPVEELATTVADLVLLGTQHGGRLAEVVLVADAVPDTPLGPVGALDRLGHLLGVPARVLGPVAAMALAAASTTPSAAGAAASAASPPASAAGSLRGGAGGSTSSAGPAVAVLDVGPDLGAAVVVDGALVLGGGRGPADALGHCVVPGQDHPCRCGRRGCLAAVFSPAAIGARHRARGGDGSADDVARLGCAADAGDVAARAVLDEIVAWTAYAGAVLASCHQLDVVVFTGLAADLGQADQHRLEVELARLASPGAVPALEVAVRRRDVDVLLAGAVAAALGRRAPAAWPS